MAEFGTTLPDDVDVRVWDSSAEVRDLVLPLRPAGTEDLDEHALAALVTRDHMIGSRAMTATGATSATSATSASSGGATDLPADLPRHNGGLVFAARWEGRAFGLAAPYVEATGVGWPAFRSPPSPPSPPSPTGRRTTRPGSRRWSGSWPRPAEGRIDRAPHGFRAMLSPTRGHPPGRHAREVT